MVGITVAGRTLLRPLYKRVAGGAGWRPGGWGSGVALACVCLCAWGCGGLWGGKPKVRCLPILCVSNRGVLLSLQSVRHPSLLVRVCRPPSRPPAAPAMRAIHTRTVIPSHTPPLFHHPHRDGRHHHLQRAHPAGGAGHLAHHSGGRPLPGPGRLPGRPAAGRDGVPPAGGERHRALQGAAHGPLLHDRCAARGPARAERVFGERGGAGHPLLGKGRAKGRCQQGHSKGAQGSGRRWRSGGAGPAAACKRCGRLPRPICQPPLGFAARASAPAVGMEISVPLFFAKFRTIVGAMALLIAGKVAVMAAVGQAFGLTLVQSMRRWAVCVCGFWGGDPAAACTAQAPALAPLLNRPPPLLHAGQRRTPWPTSTLLPPQRPPAGPRRRVCVCAVWGGGGAGHHGGRAGKGALPGGGAEVCLCWGAAAAVMRVVCRVGAGLKGGMWWRGLGCPGASGSELEPCLSRKGAAPA